MSIKVLYIGGTGRSGSTFLSQLLSQNADTMNIGQIRDFPNAVRRNHLCSCGSHIEDCRYWSGVVAAPGVADALERMNFGRKEFRRASRRRAEWNSAAGRQQLLSEHAEYLADVKTLYQAAASVAGGRTLVDSSKSPELALALLLNSGIDLHVLNLVRDPRAIAVSWVKRHEDESRAVSSAKEWLQRQALYDVMAELLPGRFRLLRYEDLTASPRQTISEVLKWAGLDPATGNFTADNAANVSWANQHLFPPANEEVLRAKSTAITIRAADSWKTEANRASRELAEGVAFPQAETYGYARRIA